jgi:hypothetical protein
MMLVNLEAYKLKKNLEEAMRSQVTLELGDFKASWIELGGSNVFFKNEEFFIIKHTGSPFNYSFEVEVLNPDEFLERTLNHTNLPKHEILKEINVFTDFVI